MSGLCFCLGRVGVESVWVVWVLADDRVGWLIVGPGVLGVDCDLAGVPFAGEDDPLRRLIGEVDGQDLGSGGVSGDGV